MIRVKFYLLGFRRFFQYELQQPYDESDMSEVIIGPLDLGNTRVNARRGLDTLMCALATSGVRLLTMEWAAALENHHLFKIYRPEDSFVNIFRNLETSSLLDSYSPRSPLGDRDLKDGKLSTIVITKEAFPALRSLTIDYVRRPYGRPRKFGISTLSASIEAPAITSLMIKNVDISSHNGEPSSVKRYGHDLTSLSLQSVYETSWADLLDVARQCNLERLDMAQSDEGLWERITIKREEQFQHIPHIVLGSISPEAIESVAKVMAVSPPDFVEAWELYWDERMKGGHGD